MRREVGLVDVKAEVGAIAVVVVFEIADDEFQPASIVLRTWTKDDIIFNCYFFST